MYVYVWTNKRLSSVLIFAFVISYLQVNLYDTNSSCHVLRVKREQYPIHNQCTFTRANMFYKWSQCMIALVNNRFYVNSCWFDNVVVIITLTRIFLENTTIWVMAYFHSYYSCTLYLALIKRLNKVCTCVYEIMQWN